MLLYVYIYMYVCINVCIYDIYKGLCQSRLSTTNHAVLLIAPATTVVVLGRTNPPLSLVRQGPRRK
jgi:hypothetical protein